MMVDSVADGVHSACSLARIQARLPDASLVGRALAIDETLWMAIGRAAEVALLAAANNPGSFKFADRERTARAGETGLCWLLGLSHDS